MSRILRVIPGDPMRGPDVAEVQRRLKEQGFYWQELDGVYGPATADAVARFQESRGLKADGEVDANTWTQIGLPPMPSPLTKYVITIDLGARRLYLKQGGKTLRVFPVAVGNPQTPTPVGRWLIVQKVMNPGGPFGSRWMRLSIPWGGYGVHGTDNPASINQPVSHGCIRLRNQDVEWLYNQVPIGTLVITTGTSHSGSVLLPDQAAGPDVEIVQQQLQTLGYYTGPIDGLYTGATVEAVRRFQKDQGLAVDGVVGPATYDALLKAYDKATGAVEP
jgi:L,D-transpeptidase ErfK/SrfK